jgi:hypothetical protein
MLNKYIKHLEQRLEILKNNINKLVTKKEELLNIKDIMSSFLNNNIISNSDIDKIDKFINSLAIDNLLKTKLHFIFNVLLKIDSSITLDESQKEKCHELLSIIAKEISKLNIEELNRELEKENRLISALKSDEVFTMFDELSESLRENAIDNQDKVKIVYEIILKNNKKEIVNKVEETNIVYNNSTSDLQELFKEFNLSFDNMPIELQNELKMYGNLSEIRILLNALISSGLSLDRLFKNKQLFVKILLNSNIDIINNLKKICEENNLDFLYVLNKRISVLVPNKNRFSRRSPSTDNYLNGEIGCYNNFVENMQFFKEQGMQNIDEVFKKNPTTFFQSYRVIKNNFTILKVLYGIDFSDGVSLTGLNSGNAINVLDRFIEVSELGYDYVKDCRSVISMASSELLYKIKIVEEYESNPVIRESVQNSNLPLYTDKPLRINGSRVTKSMKLVDSKTDDLELLKEVIGEEELENNPKDIKLLVDSLLGSVISINDSVFNYEYVRYIEDNFKVNDFVYLIGNTRISRIKLLRICTLLIENNYVLNEDNIKFALAYNSILSKQDRMNINSFTTLSRNSGGRQ